MFFLTIKSDSFKDSSQRFTVDTIFSKHSSALARTNGSLSCLTVFKTAIDIRFNNISLIKILPIKIKQIQIYYKKNKQVTK